MPTRSCAAFCRESPTRLSTASKWFSPNWPTKSLRQRPPTQETLSTPDFSKSSIVPAISMAFTVKLSIQWRLLNNRKIGPQLAKRIPEDILATFHAASSLQDIGRRLRGQTCFILQDATVASYGLGVVVQRKCHPKTVQ